MGTLPSVDSVQVLPAAVQEGFVISVPQVPVESDGTT
jgi:hypothetical protein